MVTMSRIGCYCVYQCHLFLPHLHDFFFFNACNTSGKVKGFNFEAI